MILQSELLLLAQNRHEELLRSLLLEMPELNAQIQATNARHLHTKTTPSRREATHAIVSYYDR
jgi:hypothetical protein